MCLHTDDWLLLFCYIQAYYCFICFQFIPYWTILQLTIHTQCQHSVLMQEGAYPLCSGVKSQGEDVRVVDGRAGCLQREHWDSSSGNQEYPQLI